MICVIGSDSPCGIDVTHIFQIVNNVMPIFGLMVAISIAISLALAGMSLMTKGIVWLLQWRQSRAAEAEKPKRKLKSEELGSLLLQRLKWAVDVYRGRIPDTTDADVRAQLNIDIQLSLDVLHYYMNPTHWFTEYPLSKRKNQDIAAERLLDPAEDAEVIWLEVPDEEVRLK